MMFQGNGIRVMECFPRLQGQPNLFLSVVAVADLWDQSLHELVKQRARLSAKGFPCKGKSTERLMTKVRRYQIFE